MTEEHKEKLKVAREEARLKKEDQSKKTVELEQRMAVLDQRVSNIAGSIDKMSELLTKVINVSDHKPAPETVEKIEEKEDMGYFPPKFRRIIDKILGFDFKASLEESSGSDCLLSIIVPSEFDCRRGDEKHLSAFDIRRGLIHKATDVSDVEKWCTLFASNIKKTYPNFIPKQ